MLGWFADFFRLLWGLLYWNIRKSWFQLRRGQSACPCQTPSDSGRAFETGCEACTHWHRAARFRRVCPLLVSTAEGLRCSADTTEVRPFWGRAAACYGGLFFSAYAVGALAIFIFLRGVGYPVSIWDVSLPPLWHRLGHARAFFFFEQSKRSFAAGRSAEAVLYLANAYDFDPTNYQIGVTLAKNLQVGQPAHSDEVFERLMREHPDRRAATAQDWFRALLARGNFEKIAALAQDQILGDVAGSHAWMRALLFATRHSQEDQPLRQLLVDASPAAQRWRPVLQTELLLRAGRNIEARAALDTPWPNHSPAFAAYTVYYRVSSLIALQDTFAALDLLERNLGVIDEEARRTLRLEALATAKANQVLRNEIEQLLAPRVNLARLKILCAHLIRHPNVDLFKRVYGAVEKEGMALNSETAGIWFSLLCTAGVVGDVERLHLLAEQLKRGSPTPFLALGLVESFFRGETSERRITSLLPILPLPTEVTYALLEHYSPGQSRFNSGSLPKQ